MRVCIAGGTGFIGAALTRHWLDRGARITVLSRRSQEPSGTSGLLTFLSWDDPAWRRAVAEADVVVNLAGATISRRWTPSYKQEILNSRLRVTRQLVEALGAPGQSPPRGRRVLISGSAVGYYGPAGDLALTERNAPGEDFLATVCARWEAAARPVEDLGIRLVLLRIGLVLGRDGGVLPRMLLPFRFGLGGVLGSGRQWVSWIHIDDLCRLIIFAAQHEQLSGPVNATAPEPVTNERLTRAIARVLRRPAFLRVPAAALRLVLGEMATLLLDGQRVLPERARQAGFAWHFKDIDAALADLLGHSRRG
ncbi:MAG TPA: TIGR01777 family oxidoreductase [Bacillota bacterium]